MTEGEKLSTPVARRDALKYGVGGAAAAVLAGGVSMSPAGAATPAVTKWKDPLPKPPELLPAYRHVVLMRQRRLEVHSDVGPITKLWAYGNAAVGFGVPGPTFRVNRGDAPRILWKNRLSRNPDARHILRMDPRIFAGHLNGGVHGAVDNRAAIVHIHGLKTTEAGDGWPEFRFKPGSQRLDIHPALDKHTGGTTLWYHDHNLGTTAINVMMGLAGFFLIDGPWEQDLIDRAKLPSRDHEMPLMILDRRLGADGQVEYEYFHDDHFFGDTPIVNGKAYPHMEVEARHYRFRVVNACNSRTLNLELGDGSLVMHVIGSDQGFLKRRQEVTNIVLTPGERADIVIDFAQAGVSVNDDLILRNTFVGMHEAAPIPELMQFRVKANPGGDPVSLPTFMQSAADRGYFNSVKVSNAVRGRQFELEDVDDPIFGSKWIIGDGGWLDDYADAAGTIRDAEVQVQDKDIEVWNWVNKTDMIHPMHTHLAAFKVVGRWVAEEGPEGRAVPGQNIGVDPHETGWKDTVRVGAFELVRTLVKFEGRAGLAAGQKEAFPYHCHVLEHEDHEMMRFFELTYT